MRANNKGMVQQFQLNHSGIHDQSSTSLRLLGANVS